MGAAYYIIPEEAEYELVNVKLAYIQLISLAVVGVIAIIGYHFNYWEGRKFLEIPRPLDYLVVINVLTFLGLILATLYKGKKTHYNITGNDHGISICCLAVFARHDLVR
jgi:nitric oxide reductase subunit B